MLARGHVDGVALTSVPLNDYLLIIACQSRKEYKIWQ